MKFNINKSIIIAINKNIEKHAKGKLQLKVIFFFSEIKNLLIVFHGL